MKFSDQGLVIKIKPHGENSAIVKIFSKENGIYSGYVKNVSSKRNKLVFQVGNLISFQWQSRVDDGLGSFTYCDLIKSYISRIIFDKLKFYAINSLLQIINHNFQERESISLLYHQLISFCELLISSDNESSKGDIFVDYNKLEFGILTEIGYGIDTSSCAVTDSEEGLIYVSPRSARVVSEAAGEPYKDKILTIPDFLLRYGRSEYSEKVINNEDIALGLKLTSYFLEKYQILPDEKVDYRDRFATLL